LLSDSVQRPILRASAEQHTRWRRKLPAFQNIREQRGLVYSIYSMLNLYQDAGSLVVYAGAAHDKASEVIELVLKEFEFIRAKLVSAQELKRAKEYVKGSIC